MTTMIMKMLGAICGSAISMDLLAQSMDPYSAQKSMDCADICGSLRVVACAVRGKYSPARQRYYRTRVCCAISVVIFLDSLHYMFGQLFPTYQSGAKRKCVIIVGETGASSPTGHVRHLAFTSLQFFFW